MARDGAYMRPELTFNEARLRASFHSYLETAAVTCWVAEDLSGIVGFLASSFYEYRAFDGLFTTQEVLFVKPVKRGTRAAAMLMCQMIEWSRMLGAKEIVGGNDTNFNSERTARFLSKFGFECVGFTMRKGL